MSTAASTSAAVAVLAGYVNKTHSQGRAAGAAPERRQEMKEEDYKMKVLPREVVEHLMWKPEAEERYNKNRSKSAE